MYIGRSFIHDSIQMSKEPPSGKSNTPDISIDEPNITCIRAALLMADEGCMAGRYF